MCENGDLQNLIEKETKLKTSLVRGFAAQLVHVLAFLQAHEVMHRDLKPSNILLDDQYNIKIVRNCGSTDMNLNLD